MDLKIFCTVDQGGKTSRDATQALDIKYWEPDSILTMVKATSTVSFEIYASKEGEGIPFPRITPKYPVSSNF